MSERISIEDAVVQRLIELRGDKSYREISAQLEAVGTPIAPSSLHKLEKGSPRRSLTVNELFGFAAIYNVTVSSLIGIGDEGAAPPETARYAAYAHEALRSAVKSLESQKRHAAFAWGEARDALQQLDYLRSVAGYDTNDLRRLLEKLRDEVEDELEELNNEGDSDGS
jgi:hypothetical protein